MYRILLRPALALCAVLVAAGTPPAAPTEKDKKLLAEVSAKLLAVCDKPDGFEWDKIDIGFTREAGKEVNAYATYTMTKEGKRLPILRIGERMMAKVIWGEKAGDEAGAADRLAFVVGHELGHLVKDHFKGAGNKAPVLAAAFARDHEIEADMYGLQLVLKAGYDLDKALAGVARIKDYLKAQGLGYSSFEGLGQGHPSWDDRLVKADKDKAHLWKAMAAFENGLTFLTTEDYTTAITCFDKVTRQFPGCYEAWANLGYARLMKYCDQWDKKDLKEHGVGQVVVGGFYTRITSGKAVRGKDKKLWFDAVGALRESNRLKVGQTVVLANLGLAYLLAPEGKDVGESTRFFADAAAAAKTDKDLDPVVHAQLLINLGVNTLAAGDPEKALAQLDEGEKIVRSLAVAAKRAVPRYDPALLYTRAMIYAGKADKADKEKAHEMLEKYLRSCSLRSLWWDQGYDTYTEVCKAIGKEPKAKAAFKKDRPEPVRLVTGVKVKIDGKEQTVTLGDDFEDVEKALGKGQESIAIQGTNALRVRYEKEGVELLVGDKVLAIILTGPNAPAVPLVGKMSGTGKVGELKVGMAAAEVEELLGDVYDPLEVASTGVYYNFYREQGVAVRVQKGKVVAVVIVKIP